MHFTRLLPRLVCVAMCSALVATGRTTTIRRADPQSTKSTIHYVLQPLPDATPPQLLVNMDFDVSPADQIVDLQMPVWSPGDYHLQNHGRFVQQIAARAAGANGRRLAITRPDAETWEVNVRGVTHVVVSYVLPNSPPGIFSENVFLQPHYAFFNGPATYLYAVGRKESPTEVTVRLPRGWHAEMPLPPVLPVDASAETSRAEQPASGLVPGDITYAAADYDTLADSPLVMGDNQGLTSREFKVDGIVHRAVYFGHPETLSTLDLYTPILQKIVQAENDIMGGPPYTHYDFLFAAGEFPAGLEHLNSARIGLWPNADPVDVGSLVAHEFFHLWNVKRIRPRVLGPFDYIHPPHTRNLWFAEGVTEYYAHIALRRAGITTRDEFMTHWRHAIASLLRNPARLRVTADEASLRVWESGDSQGFGGLSYYQKGELIGLCLDLKIRAVTHNRKSLDDVMRALMKQCNPPGAGYDEDGIKAVVNKIAGTDLSELYDLLARSTNEMPFAACLGYAGLDMQLEPTQNATAEMIALRDSWATGKIPSGQ